MKPLPLLFLLLTATTSLSAACPFNTTNTKNPCRATECITSTRSSNCKKYVEQYCQSSSDLGCVLFQTKSSCPFDGKTHNSNPCRLAVCDDPRSVGCGDHVENYCRDYSEDVGCVSFAQRKGQSKSSLSPSLAPSPCPFHSTSAGNPCTHSVCDVPESETCRNLVSSYCKVHPDDNGCLLFENAPKQKTSCPFNSTSASNPCSVQHCTESTSEACIKYVASYCNQFSSDTGCLLFEIDNGTDGVQNKDNDNKYCPFDGNETTPCQENVCIVKPTSSECRHVVESYCSVNKDDVGCVLFEQKEAKYCPFDGNETTPCQEKPCMLNATSSECRRVVESYCSTNTNDVGCVLFRPRPVCPRLQQRDFDNDGECRLCPDGTIWQPGLHNYGICTPCPAGTSGNGSGVEACVACKVGTHQLQIGSTRCDLCPIGTFGGTGDEGITICVNCPVGTASNLTGRSDACITCTPGNIASTTGSSTCTPCSGGEYQSDPGKSVCNKCSPGQFSSAIGSVRDVCQRCPIGRAAKNSGSSICPICASGQYQKYSGQPECIQCIPGRALPSSNSTDGHDHEDDCRSCSAGSFAESGAAVCSTCGPGKYQAGSASGACLACPAGRALPATNEASDHDGVDDCNLCSSGRYSLEGSHACTVCQGGSYQSFTGRSSCDNCTRGKVNPTTNDASEHDHPEDCVYCTRGKEFIRAESPCQICNSGTYQSLTASLYVKCLPCEAGKALLDDGEIASLHDNAGDCNGCPAGYSAIKQSAECLPCEAGHSQSQKESESCVSNFKRNLLYNNRHCLTFPNTLITFPYYYLECLSDW